MNRTIYDEMVKECTILKRLQADAFDKEFSVSVKMRKEQDKHYKKYVFLKGLLEANRRLEKDEQKRICNI